ncbi:MAG: hypothetical protein ACM3ZT_02770 [Bacillota bacterium]
MNRPLSFHPVRAGVFGVCLAISGCGLKANLYLQLPPTTFPPTPTRAPAPPAGTVAAPPSLTLVPASGSVEAPSAATLPAPASPPPAGRRQP